MQRVQVLKILLTPGFYKTNLFILGKHQKKRSELFQTSFFAIWLGYSFGSQPGSYSLLQYFMASRSKIRPVVSSTSKPLPIRDEIFA